MHADTADARGVLAIGLAREGKDQAALQEFRLALPVLIAKSRENANDDDPTSVVLARSQIVQDIAETYISLLAKSGSMNIAAETFAVADAMRGHSVQQAWPNERAHFHVRFRPLRNWCGGKSRT